MYHQEFAICIGAIHVALAYSTPASPPVSRPQTQMLLCLVSCRCFLGHPREVCFTQEGGQDSVILSPGRYAIYRDQLQYLIHMLFLGKPTSRGQGRPRYLFYLCRTSGIFSGCGGHFPHWMSMSRDSFLSPIVRFAAPHFYHTPFTKHFLPQNRLEASNWWYVVSVTQMASSQRPIVKFPLHITCPEFNHYYVIMVVYKYSLASGSEPT